MPACEHPILPQRATQVAEVGDLAGRLEIACDRPSVSGSVSQRACVFCGSRVVLYPIADALHVVHGPVGCAVYTWDIRGSLSSGPELHRHSFSTDLREMDVIYGGEKKLQQCLLELIAHYRPAAAFVYATCIVGIIGDDIEAVCRKVAEQTGIAVLAVHSEGFKGTKKDGYGAACLALGKLIGTGDTAGISPTSINILGEFNLAGEAWIIRDYYRRLGVEVVATMTGDGRIADIRRAHGAALNVVQCSGSMMPVAKLMQERYGIPFRRVSYFGVDDVAKSLYDVAEFFGQQPEIMERARELVAAELAGLYSTLDTYRRVLAGKRVAIFVGGAFKAFSLIKALRLLDMTVVLAGSQTGNRQDYQLLGQMCDPGTIIVDDTNPAELSRFIVDKQVDLFIGGVKERPMAYKLGVAFCDHNHERKTALAGFVGMLNFAREVYHSVSSPVWRFAPRREREKR